jgi:hypothetical protein
MRLREFKGITNWPPTPGGSYRRGQAFPTDEDSVVLKKVFPVMNEFVIFTCEFGGYDHTYFLQTEDEALAGELARWMTLHIGRKLSDFGNFPLDL